MQHCSYLGYPLDTMLTSFVIYVFFLTKLMWIKKNSLQPSKLIILSECKISVDNIHIASLFFWNIMHGKSFMDLKSILFRIQSSLNLNC